VTVQKNFRIITNIRAECYIYIYIYGYREVPSMKVCSALPWHGFSWFFWPAWHFPSVWRQNVSWILVHGPKVRFKLIVKVSYSGYTFIYIKTASIEGSIFHLLSNLVRSASTHFLPNQLAQIVITIGPIHSKPNYPGWLQEFPSKNFIRHRIPFSFTALVLLLRLANVQNWVQFLWNRA